MNLFDSQLKGLHCATIRPKNCFTSFKWTNSIEMVENTLAENGIEIIRTTQKGNTLKILSFNNISQNPDKNKIIDLDNITMICYKNKEEKQDENSNTESTSPDKSQKNITINKRSNKHFNNEQTSNPKLLQEVEETIHNGRKPISNRANRLPGNHQSFNVKVETPPIQEPIIQPELLPQWNLEATLTQNQAIDESIFHSSDTNYESIYKTRPDFNRVDKNPKKPQFINQGTLKRKTLDQSITEALNIKDLEYSNDDSSADLGQQ
ncbi:hypothetical protein ACTFIZ_003258 [Dictyostelium cf. discoideum]